VQEVFDLKIALLDRVEQHKRAPSSRSDPAGQKAWHVVQQLAYGIMQEAKKTNDLVSSKQQTDLVKF
jgi:hypothetical protein